MRNCKVIFLQLLCCSNLFLSGKGSTVFSPHYLNVTSSYGTVLAIHNGVSVSQCANMCTRFTVNSPLPPPPSEFCGSFRYDEVTKECILYHVTQNNIGNGTTKAYLFGIKTTRCMITYPGMKLSEAGAVEFCARQGSGGMLAEPRTEDEMDALQEGLAYWRVPWTRVGLIKHPTNTTDNLVFWKSTGLTTPVDLSFRALDLTYDPTMLCVKFGGAAMATMHEFTNAFCNAPLVVTCQIC